jgi:hypothetical protein
VGADAAALPHDNLIAPITNGITGDVAASSNHRLHQLDRFRRHVGIDNHRRIGSMNREVLRDDNRSVELPKMIAIQASTGSQYLRKSLVEIRRIDTAGSNRKASGQGNANRLLNAEFSGNQSPQYEKVDLKSLSGNVPRLWFGLPTPS